MTREWTVTQSPKRTRLNGVESVDDVAYCAGDRGVLLERVGPAEWRAVFTAGPGGDARNVFDLSITDDAERVWFAGAAGTLGHYDRASGTVHTHDNPYGITSTFNSVSTRGTAGSETVHVADDGGEIVRGEMAGADLTVRGVSIPGDGTALTEVVDNDRELFASDGAGTFYHSTDGRHWKRRRLADSPVRAIAFDGGNAYEVAADGTVFEEVSLFGEGSREPRSIQSGIASPTELDAESDVVAVGGGGGQLAISERGSRFVTADPDTDRALYGLEVTAAGTVIGVGTAGTIVEGVPR